MADLAGQPGELRFTLEIKRAATGEVEKVEMVGRIGSHEQMKEETHGSDPQHGGA